jgi:hypothetical protein
MMVFICMGISACAYKKDSPPEPEATKGPIIVTIRPVDEEWGPGPRYIWVDIPLLKIKYGTDVTVRWVKEGFPEEAPDTPNFHIHFNKPPHHLHHGTPFDGSDFGIGKDENGENLPSDDSGVVKFEPDGARQFDYTVKVPGYIHLDPGIIIWD